MYMHRPSYHRMRSAGESPRSKQLFGSEQRSGSHPTISVTSPKRKASNPASPSSLSSPRVNGDFQMLSSTVSDHRLSVRKAREALASSLDRIGEHHVRRKEYDEAMDAFTEALHEKRSTYANFVAVSNHSDGTEGMGCILDTKHGQNSDEAKPSELHDHAIDEIIITLRNMGNVHSLRGEQDEAMRYYTEVTNLNAIKSCKLDGDDNSTLFSGLVGEEDNSTLMSEINEDVKALDDMFRSISFRNQDTNSLGLSTGTSHGATKPLAISTENIFSPSNKRRKGNRNVGNVSGLSEPELFRRSSSQGFPSTGNEITEALELFRTVLDEFSGDSLETHQETYNSLALRVDLLTENNLRSDPTTFNSSTGSDLELALEIYEQILKLQDEQDRLECSDTTSNECCSNRASTLIRMGSIYYKLGNRTEELNMYNEAKEAYSRAFGENHVFVAGARKNIGMVMAERGDYEDAMSEFDQARRTYLAANDNSDLSKDVASAISCMGNVKNRVGELDDALAHYTDALRIYRSLYDSTDDDKKHTATAVRDVTSTLKVIGMVKSKKGDLDGAMDCFTEAMNLLRSSGVDSTPQGIETTASVLTRIASIYVKKGDHEQAMEHYRQAYELTVHARGTANHQDVAGILHYIGGILHKRSDYDEAMNCYQEAIRIYHSTLGPGNPLVAGTLVMVGSIHYKRRNLDSAMMFYREALRLNRDAYGLHHPDVAPILKSIGTILTKKGDFRDAYDVFRDVLSIKCTIFGTCHPEVASAYKSLGNVHYKLGELADAERQYRHALSIYRRTRGNDHPNTVAARTTIEHIRYWMKERGQRGAEERHVRSSSRNHGEEDERSC